VIKFSLCLILGSVSAHFVLAEELLVPRRHDRPPGPPITAEEAIQRMTVPEGFTVEVVAAEPDIVNPVAMCIDERGRYWVTESLEYPRREPGPGRDRIKVLEDTDGDGRVDKVTVFAEGLNIPSGIAVGYGGVWVANAPDILFLQDLDGDLKVDRQEVILTGFGRTDTHELPNSLTWGPDGWLYGLNGVFNSCDVRYGPDNPNFDPEHPGWMFTAAMFRIHPRTREFQLFAQGTSNPWGIAFNDEGEAFISACVIDHLWHISETGSYTRQGGPYPPHTWPMRSIVDHKHQKAAYCGIVWFDSPAYPPEYRNVLYMGNIHGGCLNADIASRSGSTYKGRPHPGFPPHAGAWDRDHFGTLATAGDANNPQLADLLTANDPWFMPVAQKIGPDGCLYILDWYDRYHCYQDANADPAGIERERGRLYRLVYRGHQNRKAENLGARSDDELIVLLGDANVYKRETAQRLLAERSNATTIDKLLSRLANSTDRFSTQQRHALWTLVSSRLNEGSHGMRAEELSAGLVKHGDPWVRSWGFRLRAALLSRRLTEHSGRKSPAYEWVMSALEDADVRVVAQGVQFVTRLMAHHSPAVSFDDALAGIVSRDDVDGHLIHLVWNSFRAACLHDPGRVDRLLPVLLSRVNGTPSAHAEIVRRLLDFAVYHQRWDALAEVITTTLAQPEKHSIAARDCLLMLADRVQSGEVVGVNLQRLQARLQDSLLEVLKLSNHPLRVEAALLALSARWPQPTAVSPESVDVGRAVALDESAPQERRFQAFQALTASRDPCHLATCRELLDRPQTSPDLKARVVGALSHADPSQVASLVLERFSTLPETVQSRAIELLTQRPEWAQALLAAISNKQIPKESLNLNQARRVASFPNMALKAQVRELFGMIREGRNPNREQVSNQMRDFLRGTPGDPHQGASVFQKVCAQCHVIYGEGAEVGPDITRNGRNSWDQLLTNVFDPSAVIGPGYQACVLVTSDGRVWTGLAVEESDQRVVLKMPGNKIETIPRDQIDEYRVSEVSLMPEELEKQLTPQQLADLFAFLALDKHPSDPTARILAGAPLQQHRGKTPRSE
jgi:putative membrane-bound dehydrogenase-like protein